MSTDMNHNTLEADFQTALATRDKVHEELLEKWTLRMRAKSQMTLAYKKRNIAYTAKEVAVAQAREIQSSNGKIISSLKSTRKALQVEREELALKSQAAYSDGNGYKARRPSNQAKSLKPDIDSITAQIDALIQENQDSRGVVRAAHAMMNEAIKEVKETRQEFEEAKTAHTKVRERLIEAKQEVYRTSAARVSAEEVQQIMNTAAIPDEYCSNIHIQKDENDRYNIYYGGRGSATGPGHGHAVVEPNGELSHDRKPNTENSPENFTSDQAFAEFKQARNSKGGFGLAQHIFYRGNPITTATGWGNQENMVAFVLGHVNKVKFHDMPNKRIMKQSDYMKM